MELWVIWLIVAVALGVAELFTLTTALGILGAAAILTSATAAIGLPVPIQLLVFVLSSAGGVVAMKPFVARSIRLPAAQRFGIDALVGKTAYVIAEVTGREGRVRLNGEDWSARAYDETLVIPTGATVDVIEIEGATALVYPRE